MTRVAGVGASSLCLPVIPVLVPAREGFIRAVPVNIRQSGEDFKDRPKTCISKEISGDGRAEDRRVESFDRKSDPGRDDTMMKVPVEKNEVICTVVINGPDHRNAVDRETAT
jgi:hypothetical protein